MKFTLLSITTLAVILTSPLAVLATSAPQISVPVSTIVRGSEGSTKVLGSQTINQELIGMDCIVNATAKNQGSVHPGNDLIISSGDNKVILKNVEREANGITEASGTLTLSNELVVALKLGSDKVFSGGMTVNLTCEKPIKIQVCRDGIITTIREDEALATDTDVCPVEKPKQIKVCRDGGIITINELDKKTTDTDSCPQVLSAGTELPKTGTGSIVAIIAGSGVFGTIAHSVSVRRRS